MSIDRAAAERYTAARLTSGELTVAHVTELVRAWQEEHGLEVDGKAGPVTTASIEDAIASTSRPPVGAVYPLRALADGRAPVITSGHKSRNPSRPTHNGADLFYRYMPGDPPMRIGDGGRTAKWWIPDGTEAIAALEGTVVLAGYSRTGHRVWIDVGGGWAIGYFHLAVLAVRVGMRVGQGATIGIVGDNPAATDARHLHFELYRGDVLADVEAGRYPRGTVDPELLLSGARVLPAR